MFGNPLIVRGFDFSSDKSKPDVDQLLHSNSSGGFYANDYMIYNNICPVIGNHKVEANDINAIGKDYALKFGYCENDFVQNQLKPGEQYIAKMAKYCDCGTLLGSLNKKKTDNIQRIEKAELEKLKKKGWSYSKIERFIADKNKSAQKQAFSLEIQKANAIENIKEWTDFINRLFTETTIDTFGLLLHWYSGSVDYERIKINRRERVPKIDLTGMKLLEMEEDSLYLICK